MVKFHPTHPIESTVSQPLSHLKSSVELNLGVLVAYAFVLRIAIKLVLVQMLPLCPPTMVGVSTVMNITSTQIRHVQFFESHARQLHWSIILEIFLSCKCF